MNKANSQKNFEMQLESIRNYADHSPIPLTPTVQLKPIQQLTQRRQEGKAAFGTQTWA